jgi:hypothetical protein
MLLSTELLFTLAGVGLSLVIVLLWRCSVFCHTSPYGVLTDKETVSPAAELEEPEKTIGRQTAALTTRTKPEVLKARVKLSARQEPGARRESVENEVGMGQPAMHDMESFTGEGDKAGWNVGFSVRCTDREPEAPGMARTRVRAPHYTPSTDRGRDTGPSCVQMVPARRVKVDRNVTDDRKANGSEVIIIKDKNLFDEIERRESERKRLKEKNDAFFAKLGNVPLDLKNTKNQPDHKSRLSKVPNSQIEVVKNNLKAQKEPPQDIYKNSSDQNSAKEWEVQRPSRSRRRRNSEPVVESGTPGRTTVKVINCVAITVGEAAPQQTQKPKPKRERKKVKIDVPRKVEATKEQNFYKLPIKTATPPRAPTPESPTPPPPPSPPAATQPAVVEKRARIEQSPPRERRRWSSDVSVTPFRLSSDRRNFVTDAMFAGSIYVGEKDNITDYERLGVPSCAVEEFSSWRDRFNQNMKH